MADPEHDIDGREVRRRRRPGPILVVSAFTPELAPLRDALRIRGNGQGTVVCLPVGIGAVDAAAGTARAIARLAPRALLFVGTAGSYGGEPPIGGVAIGRWLRLASTAAARGDGYLPGLMIVKASTDSALRRGLLENAGSTGGLADIATPLAITKTSALARRLSKATGCTVENLEAFSVARAANVAGVPFAAVLGISNRVGPRAHMEWRRHQQRAVIAASVVVEAYLTSLVFATAPSRSAPRRGARPG